MTIPLRLLVPKEKNGHHDPQRLFVENWIRHLIQYDTKRGRSVEDFVTKGTKQVVEMTVPLMEKQGFTVYGGGGNFFYVKYNRLTPIVVHVRPLAHRVIRPRFV